MTGLLSKCQHRNRDSFSRPDYLYPPLAALGSICDALCRIEVESWFACRVCSEENQLIGYFASKALLGMNILRRRRHYSDVSRFEHALLNEFHLCMPCSTPCVATPPYLVAVSPPVYTNDRPAVMIVDRGHSFRSKASIHEGQPALILVEWFRLLTQVDIPGWFFLPVADYWICHQLSHAFCDLFKVGSLVEVRRKNLLYVADKYCNGVVLVHLFLPFNSRSPS